MVSLGRSNVDKCCKSTLELLTPDRYAQYDSFVRAHQHGWICSESVWIEILRKSFPHIHPSIHVLYDTDGGIRSAVPVYCVRSVLTGNRLVSIPFATHSDIFLASEDDAFVAGVALEELKQKTHSQYVELRSSFCGNQRHLPSGAGLHKVYKCHTISLEASLDSIYRNLHRTCVRKNITRAEKLHLTTRNISEVNEVAIFYRLYCTTRKKLFLPAMPYQFFEEIFKLLVPRKQAMFLIAEQNGIPVAALMVLMYGSKVSAEALGWDTRFIAAKPVVFIYWEAIKYALQAGYTAFDFGRTDPDTTSLMDFKSHWGAKVTDLNVYRLFAGAASRRQKRANLQSAIVDWVRRGLFTMPSPFYQLLSRMAYQHLG